MSEQEYTNSIGDILSKRFPSNGTLGVPADQSNPAIRLYGRRFYKDQTPVEYLAEFLLVFASSKGSNRDAEFSLSLGGGDGPPCYWPEDRVALKLFAFFPSSKLDTRHPVHQKAYLDGLEEIKTHIVGSDEDKDEAIRLLQSLFSGFVGVARNRTWVTHSFLPVSAQILGREIDWLHSKAVKDVHLKDWNGARGYFAVDRHNFMARGGELLFLQVAHVFSAENHQVINDLCSSMGYAHLGRNKLAELKEGIELGLRLILEDATGQIGDLADFIEASLADYKLYAEGKSASLGSIPSASLSEAFLFANELHNICCSTLGSLEKVDLLQILCCMQVLRSHCFQARRVDDARGRTHGFIGNYAWIVASEKAPSGSGVRKIAQNSFEVIEEMLYRVLRTVEKFSVGNVSKLKEADKHGFQIFRKLAKELHLVIPRTGRGQRFVLPPTLLRFLVTALVAPGERVRLTEFYSRVFAHYGIALGGRQLTVAMAWSGSGTRLKDYAVATDTTWVEELLQQGGFLVELSDAVSIVHNPGN